VSKSHTKPKVFCRLLGVALCYVFALQGFLAAYGAAVAVSQVNGSAAGFIICHNAGGDGPTDPNTRTPASVPCALCAIGASASGVVPDPILGIVAPSMVASQVRHTDITGIVNRPSARAGLARAPPRFA
jgi:hypothetical protein